MRAEWETERKFVVTGMPDGLLETRKSVPVRQGFLSSDGERHVKICDEGGIFTMMVKQGFGFKQQNTNVDISAEQFEQLWPLTKHMRVEKQRYRLGHMGHNLVLDVFAGHLAPLILVEVEFDSEMHSRQFLPPDFAEFEVTHRREYQLAHLAKCGLPDSLALMSCHY